MAEQSTVKGYYELTGGTRKEDASVYGEKNLETKFNWLKQPARVEPVFRSAEFQCKVHHESTTQKGLSN